MAGRELEEVQGREYWYRTSPSARRLLLGGLSLSVSFALIFRFAVSVRNATVDSPLWWVAVAGYSGVFLINQIVTLLVIAGPDKTGS